MKILLVTTLLTASMQVQAAGFNIDPRLLDSAAKSAAMPTTKQTPTESYLIAKYRHNFAWDQFYNDRRQLVWACRDKRSGEFAYQKWCQLSPANDYTWPSKSLY